MKLNSGLVKLGQGLYDACRGERNAEHEAAAANGCSERLVKGAQPKEAKGAARENCAGGLLRLQNRTQKRF